MDTVFITTSTYFEYDSSIPVEINGHVLKVSKTIEEFIETINEKAIHEEFSNRKLLSLLNKPYFLIRKNLASKTAIMNEAIDINTKLNSLDFYFWCVKDNNINFYETIYASPLAQGSMALTAPFSNAKGEFEDVAFSPIEIFTAINIANKLTEIFKEIKGNKKISNRIARAYSLISKLRQSHHLPERISFYILVLECLFSANDGTEITHKISERVAKYIGHTPTESLRLFYQLKNAYDIRSKYFHGQPVKIKADSTLVEISTIMDGILRKIMIKVVMEDSDIFMKPQDEIKTWFDELLFK